MTTAPSLELTSEKKRVVVSSVIAAFCLTTLKLGAGLWSGSLGLLSDAAHSGLDLLAALTTWFSVSISDRPADPSHPYGHHKVDNIAALFETLFLGTTAVWILYEATARLFFKTVTVTVNVVSFAVIAVCISVDFFRWTALSRAAKKTGSAALEANAFHFFSDIATSLVVLIGLAGIAAGYPQADAVCSIGIAVFILAIAFKLGMKAIDALTDRVPETHVDDIERAVRTVPGVSSVSNIRVRHAGNRHFIDLKAGVDAAASISSAHAVSEAIENALKNSFDNADVMVHVEPDSAEPAGLTETVFMLAQREGINVHSLQVHQVGRARHCTMHLEWPSDTTLGEAHRKATILEDHLKRKFTGISSFRSHLECCDMDPSPSRTDVTDNNADFIAVMCRLPEQIPSVSDIRDVQIMDSDGKWHISLTCSLQPSLLLRDAHRIATELESKILSLSSAVCSVHVHTEPHGAIPFSSRSTE